MSKPTIWYRTSSIDRIEAVDVVKETASFLTIEEHWLGHERRVSKSNSWGERYWRTYGEAHTHLVQRLKAHIEEDKKAIARNEKL